MIAPPARAKSSEYVLDYLNQVSYEGYLFSFGLPLEGDEVEKINVSRETSLILRRFKNQVTI